MKPIAWVLAGIFAGTTLPGWAAKLESTTAIPSDLFASRGDAITLTNQEEHPAGPIPSGTVDPQAVILPLAVSSDGMEPEIFWCAIDHSAPGTGFDTLRIDIRHTGSFKNAEILALKPAADGSKNALEISGVIKIKVNTKEIPCLACGIVNGKLTMAKQDDGPFVLLSIIPFASTMLEINGKAYRIAVADGNGNGDWTDAAKLAKKKLFPTQPEGEKAGDLFAIDLDGKGFKGRVLRGFLGIPFCLDGHWLTLNGDAGTDLTATAQPNPGTGTLELPANLRLEALLSGGGNLFPVIAGQPPIPLKAGKYRLLEGRLLGNGKTACEFKPSDSKAILEIKDGTATGFPVPRQIKLAVAAECEAVGPIRLVSLSLTMKSDTNIEIGSATAADGKSLTPILKILDAKGQVVHTGKFEFG